MGIDLTIMPLWDRRELSKSTASCYERLIFDRDYQIFAQIADPDGKSVFPDKKIEPVVRTHPLPPEMFLRVYRGKGIEKTRQNSYKEEMVYSFAEEMKRLKLPKDASSKNKAIMAYIKALEADTPIILEWR